MNCSVPNVLEPGVDVLTSEGKGDLGVAQVELPGGLDQHQKQMGKRALEPKGLEAAHVVQTICGFGSVKELCPI